jgi:hypothetical protein
MTDPSEVVVSDAEIQELRDDVARGTAPYIQVWRKAIAKLIAGRVPDAKTGSDSRCCNLIAEDTWNELRDRVLKGE